VSCDPLDPLYGALGRFVISFSQFVGNMQASVVGFGMAPGAKASRTLQIATTEMTADPLKKVFFACCTVNGDLNAHEVAIRDNLQRRASDLIERRNELMHAVWFTHKHVGDEAEPRIQPVGVYDRISHKADSGLKGRDVEKTIPELGELADEAREVAALVWLMASGCRAAMGRNVPRVSGYLQLRDGVVSRRDPYLPPGVVGQ
jgi:hypothetical protein